MANLVPNIAKGRVVELVNRVKTGDPSTSRLYVIPIDAGSVTDDQMRDADDFAAYITLGVTERGAGGGSNWNRKTLAAADITALSPDDSANSNTVDFIDLSWSPGPTSGDGNITDLVVCYASAASPTNSQLLPLSVHDFPITADGSAVLVGVAGFFTAS